MLIEKTTIPETRRGKPMKHSDLFSHIEKAALSYPQKKKMGVLRTGDFLLELRLAFLEGVEDKKPLRIRHKNTHAAKCCLED